MSKFYPINTPLVNYFFYPSTLVPTGLITPIANGKIFFFADEDHSVELPTYSDVSDPENPIPNTDPISLGDAGECPLFYLENRKYYIVITGPDGDIQNPAVPPIAHYNPSQIVDQGDEFDNNMVANGQFSYPLEFWRTDEEEGLITQEFTDIAWQWRFIQDPLTDTKNIITFLDISNEIIEGNPIFEGQLESSNIQAGEARKDFETKIGAVNYRTEEFITFSAQMQNKLSGTVFVNLLLYRNYGQNGSEPEFIEITTFAVESTRQKFVFSFEVPDIVGKEIGIGNYSALILRGGVGQLCKFSITCVQCRPGSIVDPIYVQESIGDIKGKIVGASTSIENAGLDKNYSYLQYFNGSFQLAPRTGEFVLIPLVAVASFPDLQKCDGSSLLVNGYTNNIPNLRLFNVIGDTYGGAGGLVVKANENVVTFTPKVAGRAKNAYTAGTTQFTVANPNVGLSMEVSAEKTSANVVQLTWIGDFAPVQTPPSVPSGSAQPSAGLLSYWFGPPFLPPFSGNYISVSTVDPGSGSDQAVANLTFNSGNMFDYKTRSTQVLPDFYETICYLEYAAPSTNNSRGAWPSPLNKLIMFAVDGQIENPSSVSGNKNLIVNFSSALSLEQNLDGLVNQINDGFIWTVTVTIAPLAGEYFLYSSVGTDYYGWFTVNGMGSDPMVASRTGIEIPTFSSDSLNQIAEKIANTLNDAEFNVPEQTDLPPVPDPAKSEWFIRL